MAQMEIYPDRSEKDKNNKDTLAFMHPSSLLTWPVRRKLTDRAAIRRGFNPAGSLLEPQKHSGTIYLLSDTELNLSKLYKCNMLITKFRFSILDSKLRLEEQIPHFCKVKKSLYICCVDVDVADYPALWETSEMNPPHFYLLHILLVLTYSVSTAHAWSWHLQHHVRNGCQSHSRAVSQTGIKSDWIRGQTPRSWECELHVLPVSCDAKRANHSQI